MYYLIITPFIALQVHICSMLNILCVPVDYHIWEMIKVEIWAIYDYFKNPALRTALYTGL